MAYVVYLKQELHCLVLATSVSQEAYGLRFLPLACTVQ